MVLLLIFFWIPKTTVSCFKLLKLSAILPGIRYHNGEEIYSDSRIKISRDAKRIENYNLTITLIRKEDGGEYEVRATNERGTAVTRSSVTVLGKTDWKHVIDIIFARSVCETWMQGWVSTNHMQGELLWIMKIISHRWQPFISMVQSASSEWTAHLVIFLSLRQFSVANSSLYGNKFGIYLNTKNAKFSWLNFHVCLSLDPLVHLFWGCIRADSSVDVRINTMSTTVFMYLIFQYIGYLGL